ncbi:MAG: hypothetical protein H6R10_2270 [Rhodocyclaceae bacterium]|nr:hypothetical protein [Rhodocyclaceae bacterium]
MQVVQQRKAAKDRPGTGSANPRVDLRRSRAIATGLLAAMAALFLAAGHFQPAYPWLAYLRAFTEAAMVGALADWFAVTALFRHPLGLPIPHTAVIPRNKERIGDSLGKFVEEHFLPAEVIRARLAGIDFGELIARWLADPAHADILATQAIRLLPAFLRSLDDDRVRAFLRDKITERLAAAEVAPLTGDILVALTAGNRHQQLLDAGLRHLVAIIAEKEALIRQRIRDSTGWLWKRLNLDERAFNGIMTALEDLVQEVEEDAGHELRQRFDRTVQDFARNLKESPDTRRRAEAIKKEILGNPACQRALEDLWEDLRRHLLADAEGPSSEIREHLQAAIRHLGETLLADPSLRDDLDSWLREAIAGLLESRRREVARLIPDTMRTWDADTMTERLELQVGKDLQFIRINGTLVGGLVGLGIYALSRFMGF